LSIDLETVLIFVGIPLAVIALVAALLFVGSARRNSDRRYRPGRPFDFEPVWFLAPRAAQAASAQQREASDPTRREPVASTHRGAVGAGSQRPALSPARGGVEWPAESVAHSTVTGGASDRW
jgi:hypothetical protein